MNETETRAELIDPLLAAAGWGKVADSRIRREYPITNGRLMGHGQRSKPEKADYILQYRNRNLAVVEAKASELHYTEGVGQAKDYATKLQIRFTYSTNGHRIYGIDMETGKEGDEQAYPTPDALWAMCFPDSEEAAEQIAAQWRAKLYAVPFEKGGRGWKPRYYQENAIGRVIDAIASKRTRILLTLATGTGKTAIAFQIAWKLFHARWNIRWDGERSPRILFLADRNILADQAFNAFGAFEEDALVRISPADIHKKGKVPKNGNVFFTIFQSFMSGPEGTPYFGEYEPDFFDCIIIDECHRGGANDESTWRAILNYFSPAVQLGLTATPKRDQNIDTYAYFGDPVYVYALKDGINDGFLTPFKVKQIATNFDDYIYTSDDEVLEGEIETGKVYDQSAQNRIIEIEQLERYRVQTFMDLIDQTQKTLVFCATQQHALAVRNLINQITNIKNPNYCHRVTADDGKIGEQHLRDFQDNEKSIPTILTTSQKLSTGVDAPEIRNIVLMRPVKQLIEFKQIVGRGTRLYDGKDYFTIYDFVKAYLNFADPDWDGEPQDPEPKVEPDVKIYLCRTCGEELPCGCVETGTGEPPSPCIVCGYPDCRCAGGRKIIRVRLSDGKERQLQHTTATSFWSADGKPISAEEFLEGLFGTLPELFQSEAELCAIWSKPDTRKKLLDALADKGFAKGQMEEFQKVLQAEKSDLFDILAYVAFKSGIVNRTQRAERARIHLAQYDARQQEFIRFVLDQYVQSGVYELDEEKLSPLLILKYKALADAKTELGDIPRIRETFVGFQGLLYG
jgi:type I restriction enzyme, R subunit